jgi:hypothetical protein
MTSAILQLVSVGGVAVLLTQPDPQFWVTLGLLITSAAGLITQRLGFKREERRHQWEKEERAELRASLERKVAIVAEIAATTKQDIRSDIAENTAINVAALDAANGVNEKIARLAARGIVPGTLAEDTNQTAHRIERKL